MLGNLCRRLRKWCCDFCNRRLTPGTEPFEQPPSRGVTQREKHFV
jgi:hypothetical protein